MWISKPRLVAMGVVAVGVAIGAALGATGTQLGWVGVGVGVVLEIVLVRTRQNDMHFGD